MTDFKDEMPPNWKEIVAYRKENQAWMNLAADIALTLLDEMEKQKLNKHDLVNRTGLSEELIKNVLKGQENLDLKTIALLENAFDDVVKLLKIES